MSRGRRVATVAVAVLAAATAFVSPVIAVFAAVVALNCLLGRGENIPFSMYPRFSEPSTRAWALRFETPDGGLVPIAMMGINPQVAKKRFATEVGAARRRGLGDLGAVRRHAGDVLVAEIHGHRLSTRGPGPRNPSRSSTSSTRWNPGSS